jgi:hypothetical protein
MASRGSDGTKNTFRATSCAFSLAAGGLRSVESVVTVRGPQFVASCQLCGLRRSTKRKNSTTYCSLAERKMMPIASMLPRACCGLAGRAGGESRCGELGVVAMADQRGDGEFADVAANLGAATR